MGELFHSKSLINTISVCVQRLNEKAGDGRYSGIIMWPGGTSPYQGKNATYIYEFDRNVDYFKRVDIVRQLFTRLVAGFIRTISVLQAMSWLKDPEKPANLVMLYIEQPDTTAHIYGPNSEQVAEVIRKMDNVTQYLNVSDMCAQHCILFWFCCRSSQKSMV